MLSALKARLQRIDAHLMAVVWCRLAEWLEALPEDDLGAGVLEIFFADLEACRQSDAAYREMSEEEILRALADRSAWVVQELRRQARELRGKR